MEPHRRGEILVAAMLNAFIGVWSHRMLALGEIRRALFDFDVAAEQARLDGESPVR